MPTYNNVSDLLKDIGAKPEIIKEIESHKNCHEEIGRLIAKIGSLEQEVERLRAKLDARFTHQEVASWLATYHGRYRELTLREWVERNREEKQALKGDGDEI